jgi:hypothetical protein
MSLYSVIVDQKNVMSSEETLKSFYTIVKPLLSVGFFFENFIF